MLITPLIMFIPDSHIGFIYAPAKTFLNFFEDAGDKGARGAFRDEHYTRLQQVKAKYDPQNRFRFNANITPAE